MGGGGEEGIPGVLECAGKTHMASLPHVLGQILELINPLSLNTLKICCMAGGGNDF